jgi:DNA-binding protein H-NS
MAKVNLEQLDAQGLKDVINQAQRLLAKRLENEKSRFMSEMKARAKELGLNFNDLIKATGAAGGRRKPGASGVAMKYQNPSNPDQKWSGRGRAPAWARPYKEQGRLDQLTIKD